jgi:ketosteroid isomerase-like protein
MTLRNGVLLAISAALLALAACQPGGAVTTPAEEAAVKKVLADIVTTFNAGDYDGMLADYTDDVLVQSNIGPEITSKEAWRTALKSSMPAGMKLQMDFDTSELKVAGDLAYERGIYTIQAASEGGAPQVAFKGRYVHILKRDSKGSWKGWRLFEIVDQTPPGFVAPGAAAAAPQAPAPAGN